MSDKNQNIRQDAIQIHWHTPDDSAPPELMQFQGIGAYQQHIAYGDAVRDYHGRIMRADIRYDGQLVGFVQCTVRYIYRIFRISLAMRGPVWFTELTDDVKAAIYRALKATCPLPRPRLLLWMPESADHAALRLAGLKRVVTGYSTIMLDLSQSEDALLAALDSKWRNQLRTSQKSPLSIVPVGQKPDNYLWLLEQEAAQQHRIGYSGLNPGLVVSYQAYAGANSLLVTRADLGKDTVAGMLCLIHGTSATYHIGWNSDQGREHHAHNLLLWDSILRLKQRGIRWFDLGGANTESGAGLTRFKLGTGGNLLTLDGLYA